MYLFSVIKMYVYLYLYLLIIIDLAISGNLRFLHNAMFPENSQIVVMTDFKCKAKNSL